MKMTKKMTTDTSGGKKVGSKKNVELGVKTTKGDTNKTEGNPGKQQFRPKGAKGL